MEREGVCEVFRLITGLQTTYRRGWQKRGIPDGIGETVAEHSVNVARACYLYSLHHPKLDGHTMIVEAIAHDCPEYDPSVCLDYMPGEVTPEEKTRREKRSMDTLYARIGPEANAVIEPWEEYELKRIPESRIVAQFDKFDPSVRALRYEKLGYPVQDFFPYTRERLVEPDIIRIFDMLMRREYPDIDPYQQYFSLLLCNGNETGFQQLMNRVRSRE